MAQTQHVNNPLARAFQQIVTAGWANMSDGEVEAPTGHFAFINIEPAELAELTSAVFDDDASASIIYPGSYILIEDSHGNATLMEYRLKSKALEVLRHLMREYALWAPNCPRCGNEGPHGRMVPPKGNTFVCCCGQTWDPTVWVHI